MEDDRLVIKKMAKNNHQKEKYEEPPNTLKETDNHLACGKLTNFIDSL